MMVLRYLSMMHATSVTVEGAVALDLSTLRHIKRRKMRKCFLFWFSMHLVLPFFQNNSDHSHHGGNEIYSDTAWQCSGSLRVMSISVCRREINCPVMVLDCFHLMLNSLKIILTREDIHLIMSLKSLKTTSQVFTLC